MLFVILLALACSSPEPRVYIEVPHVVQRPDFCGEACAAMGLARLGYAVDQGSIFDAAGVDPALGRGLYTRELREVLIDVGFDVGETWYKPPIEDQWAALVADLRAGVPSIVCMLFDERGGEHFRLVVGWDPAADEVILHDPFSAEGADMRLSREEFLLLWPLEGGETIIRLRLDPAGPLRVPAPPAGVSPADLAQAVRVARALAPEGFSVALEGPFVVIGDEPEAKVRQRATGLVRWASEELRAEYGFAELAEPWEIWLFRDSDSYYKHTNAIFGYHPDTPYGFALGEQRALVMNIGTGGGTLVHELVHPYLVRSFPEVPAWFNEGLASLYEASAERDGRIVGLTNWRLPGLQAAISHGALPSFSAFTDQNSYEFYRSDLGTNYAQARYLCYYLQERGLLRRLYDELRATSRQDSTGYTALTTVLGEPDMARWQREWEGWVMDLRWER